VHCACSLLLFCVSKARKLHKIFETVLFQLFARKVETIFCVKFYNLKKSITHPRSCCVCTYKVKGSTTGIDLGSFRFLLKDITLIKKRVETNDACSKQSICKFKHLDAITACIITQLLLLFVSVSHRR